MALAPEVKGIGQTSSASGQAGYGLSAFEGQLASAFRSAVIPSTTRCSPGWALPCQLPSSGGCPAQAALAEAQVQSAAGVGAQKKALKLEKGFRLGRMEPGMDQKKPTAFTLPNTWPEFRKVPPSARRGQRSKLRCAHIRLGSLLSFSLFEMKNKAACQGGWYVQTCHPHRFRKTSKWKLLGSDYISSQMVNLCPELPPLPWILFFKLVKRIYSGVICRLMS